MNRKPISSAEPTTKGGRWIVGLLGLFFSAVGGLVFWLAALAPLWQHWQSQSWVTTECTVVESQIEEVQGDESTSYVPAIRYEYQVNGRTQSANRYSFFSGGGSRKGAKKIVARYPIGSKHPCYYDPAQPDEAVLLRSFFVFSLWFSLLFPLLFILAGFLLMYIGFGSKSPAAKLPAAGELNPSARFSSSLASAPETQSDRAEFSAGSTATRSKDRSASDLAGVSPTYSERVDWQRFVGPQQLAPAISRRAMVLGAGFAALFWNGILSFFVWEMFEGRSWFMLLFLLPFLVVGLGLIYFFFYSLLGLFNPVVKIALSEGAIQLGETADLAWEVQGRVSRIAEFRILAVGEEQATYTRGTDRITDTDVFQSLELCRLTSAEEIRFGTAQLSIPADTMHSHEGTRNKLVWKLQVQGRIPWFPDIKEEYEFRVLPQGVR
ncbi:MAG: DUF3592 domain-containing protein [Planctomycetota bacterium]|jgi:hypothetical protein